MLTGGVIAAFLGPTSATYTINIVKEKYVASFMAMALIGVLNQIAVSRSICMLSHTVFLILAFMYWLGYRLAL